MVETFYEFEHAGWQLVADSYEKFLGGLTSQTIPELLNAVYLKERTRVLDIASGPGYVADAAAKRGANVTGVDFSSAMVDMARKRLPSISFEEGNAEQLAFADDKFEAITMNFGMLHLEHPEAAFKEAFRVLARGGRFAFTVWGLPEHARGFGIVLEAIKENGNSAVDLPQGPPFFRFSDENESRKEMAAAGFENVLCRHLNMEWRLNSCDDFFDAFYLGTPRTGGVLRAQSGSDLTAIKTAIFSSLETYKTGTGECLLIPMQAVIFSGEKPAQA